MERGFEFPLLLRVRCQGPFPRSGPWRESRQEVLTIRQPTPPSQDPNGGSFSEKPQLNLSALWIHDFDVSKRVEGDAFNFSASLKF
jgi:hypothetical protein